MKPGLPINDDMISRFHAPSGGGVGRRVDVLERAEVSRICCEELFLYARVSLRPVDTLRYKVGPCRSTRLVAVPASPVWGWWAAQRRGIMRAPGAIEAHPLSVEIVRVSPINISWTLSAKSAET